MHSARDLARLVVVLLAAPDVPVVRIRRAAVLAAVVTVVTVTNTVALIAVPPNDALAPH
jgi:hypothetical protein